MKHIFTLFILLFTATTLWAVPARQGIIKVTQKDGTVLTLQLVGDENLHYYLNTETGDKMQLGDDGDYYVISDEDFEAMQSAAESRMEQSNARRKARLAPKKTIGSFNNMTGTKKGLVILVNFSDVSMTSSTPQAEFAAMFNTVGRNKDGYGDSGYSDGGNSYTAYTTNGHIGSVHDYFLDQSYGQFDLSFDVVGPVTVSEEMAYYGENSNGSDSHPAEMVIEACKLADGLGVDFTKYDWDGDKVVDQVFVIYAGYGENNGADASTIWPHEWTLQSATENSLTLDEVTIDTYACTSELAGTSGTTLCGIGTACHEFSHCLGYPDTYDTKYSGGQGMGWFDIMANGNYNGPNGIGEVPVGYTAYERWMAGWLTPTELSEKTSVNNMPDLGTSPRAYIIYNDNNSNEYFLLENRVDTRWFKYHSSYPAGHGLLITHVDYDATAWANDKPNNDKDHQRLTWVSADGVAMTNKTEFFPGTENVTMFVTDASHRSVNGKWFKENGGYKSVTDITETYTAEIEETEPTGTISFNFDTKMPTSTTSVSAVGYSTYYNSLLAYKMPENMLGYVAYRDDADNFKFEKAYNSGDIVPAGVALVLKADEGSYPLEFTVDGTAPEKNDLKGTDNATTLTADDAYYFYALSLNAAGETNSVGFYWMNETGAAFPNGAHKAYLKLAKTPGAKAGYVFNDDEVSAIKDLTPAFSQGEGAIYNLAGQRVSPTTKGILIQNGRKFIQK